MTRITGLILFAGLLLVSYPFLMMLTPSAAAVNNAMHLIQLPQLVPGKLNVIDVDGIPLFVLKPDAQQRTAITVLDSHVWDKTSAGYKSELGIYVYWGLSSRWGCQLQSTPPQASPLVLWDKDAQWLGGYWDDRCEVSYDYAGRAIKSYRYTFNGLVLHVANLRTPEIFQRSGDSYLVSSYSFYDRSSFNGSQAIRR